MSILMFLKEKEIILKENLQIEKSSQKKKSFGEKNLLVTGKKCFQKKAFILKKKIFLKQKFLHKKNLLKRKMDSRIPWKIRISWVKLEREREGRNSRNLFSLSGRRLCYLFKPSTGVNQMTRTSHITIIASNECECVCYSFFHSCW